jgi:hypothetical protein
VTRVHAATVTIVAVPARPRVHHDGGLGVQLVPDPAQPQAGDVPDAGHRA